MRTKYKINENELVINIDFLYDVLEKTKNIKTIYYYVNKIIKKEQIKFCGKKIIIYINGLLVGTIYLTKYYLQKINLSLKEEINEKNSYFSHAMIMEIQPNSRKIKTKKVITY